MRHPNDARLRAATAGPPGEWANRAACTGADPDMFFVDKGGDIRPAKRLCAVCPVRQECLEYALFEIDPTDDWGVWGGTTFKERTRLRVSMRRAA